MKLSEKIQEALRQQQEINLSDPVVQKRLAAQWGYVPADAQPAPSFADAYQGAMEDVAIWKKRALEAEDLNRKFVAEINGPAYMGEPAQPAPSALAEAIIADMQAQHDSELITENDSGEALIRLDGAIAAVEDNFALAQPAPSVPVDVITDYLVSISTHVAHQEEPQAQAEIGELLRMLAAAPEAKP